MGYKIGSADITDMTNVVENYAVTPTTTTGPSSFGETTYQSNLYTQWLAYYKYIPELQAVIDKKSFWTVGKGYECDEKTKLILNRIKGNGKENFNKILYNLVRTYTINGDAYAEIVRDKAGRLINLKMLNPGNIIVVSDKNGMIIRYEQVDGLKRKVAEWQPKEMLHISWNQIADDFHGTSTIEKLEQIILMRNEAMTDLKTVFHRYVKPLIISKVDTDDADEIADFKSKLDRSVSLGENLVVPKDSVDIERVGVPQYSNLDPLPWIRELQSYFILAEGVPEVILGKGNETSEATSKIVYLAFQQMIEWNQLFLEQELKSQLGIEINLEFPASIEPDLLEDNRKDTKLTSEGVDPSKDQK